MATLDLTPMFRSTIGFDRLPSLLADALEREDLGFPPYNIEKIGEDQYRIVMAVAGFDARDLEIVQKHNRVSVRGRVQQEPERNYLYRGIAGRAFARDFDLADHVEVTGASIDQGLLSIDLRRNVPETLRPRVIRIGQAPLPAMTNQSPTPSAA